MNVLGLIAVLAATMLAGCAEELPQEEPEGPESLENLDLQADEDSGVIRGVIVDEAIVPVGGATIVLAENGRSTESSEDGGFGFGDVEPGFHTMNIDAIGFEAVSVQVEVEAGINTPPIVKVQLTPDFSELPYVEALTFNGFIACSASTPAYRVAVCGALNIVTDLAGQPPLTDDEFIAGFDIGLYPDFIQAEMVWRSTQPAGDFLQLTAEVSPTDGEDIGSVNGVSPLILQADNATIAAAGMDTSGFMQQRVFNMEHEATTPPVEVCDIPNPVHGGTMCAKGFGLTVDQKFQVFTHVFHKFLPQDGWLFIEDGAPTVPDV
ncbi:MAG: carboxypeptidase-like regulatory domain-containing protein [Thermoplasmatota archaeon]